MQKRGPSAKSAFKVRFCKLGSSDFSYYKKETDAKPAGVILLRDVISFSLSPLQGWCVLGCGEGGLFLVNLFDF